MEFANELPVQLPRKNIPAWNSIKAKAAITISEIHRHLYIPAQYAVLNATSAIGNAIKAM
jgi:hypothetical protein